jgi:hypothetical protein
MRSDESIEESRRNLDAEAAEQAWAEGREMGTDKAIAYALEGSGYHTSQLIGDDRSSSEDIGVRRTKT